MRKLGTDTMELPAWGWPLVGLGAAVAVLGVIRRQQQRGQDGAGRSSLRLHEAITIQAPAARLYEMWRNPAIHSVLRNASVTALDAESGHWHWRRELTGSGWIEGDIRTTREEPPVLLEWATENLRLHLRHGAPLFARQVPIRPHGMLRLRPIGSTRGEATEVRLSFTVGGGLRFPLIAPRIGAGMRTALRRLRALAEAGEIATTEGQPSGPRSRRGRAWLAALAPGRSRPPQGAPARFPARVRPLAIGGAPRRSGAAAEAAEVRRQREG